MLIGIVFVLYAMDTGSLPPAKDCVSSSQGVVFGLKLSCLCAATTIDEDMGVTDVQRVITKNHIGYN